MSTRGRQARCVGLALAVLLAAAWGLSVSEAAAENQARRWGEGEDFGWAGNVSFYLGRAYLDDSEWAPVESQNKFGIDLDFTNSDYPFGAVFDLYYSKASDSGTSQGVDVSVDLKTTEFAIGPRKVWYRFKYFRPFLGLGVNLVHVEGERKFSGTKESDNGTGVGFWGELGAYVTLYGPVHLGADLRWSTARVRVFDDRRDAGGLSVGLLLGVKWTD